MFTSANSILDHIILTQVLITCCLQSMMGYDRLSFGLLFIWGELIEQGGECN